MDDLIRSGPPGAPQNNEPSNAQNPADKKAEIAASGDGGEPIGRKKAALLLSSGAAAALAYTICFCGAKVFPLASFAIFCPAAFAALVLVLGAHGHLKNKRALLLFIPVVIFASFNAIFNLNPFTYGNVIAMHALFAAFVLCAARERPAEIFSPAGAEMGMRVVAGDWTAFFRGFKSLFGGGREQRSAALRKILLGVVIAVPVLLLVGYLLVSADMVFDRLIGSFFSRLSFTRIWYAVTFMLAWIYTSGYALHGARVAKAGSALSFPRKRADAVVGATFLGLLNAVFLAFTLVQCAYLFGHGLMTLPEGMVYSQYAREGFFQLLFVTVINFSVLLAFMSALRGARESRLLRGLLLALCAFTAVLIASSFYRMSMYIGAYGHTTLRLCVLTFLAMESAGLCLAAAELITGRAPLIRGLAIIGLVFYAAVNFTGSDWFAARLNAAMLEAGKLEAVDVRPMLGTDGLCVIKPLMESGEYVCAVNIRNNRYDDTFQLVRSGSPLSGSGERWSFARLAARGEPLEKVWQNWTYFQSKIGR